LMQKEAVKTQEQDKTISEKIAELGILNVEEGDQMISAEQLETQRQTLEDLKVERDEIQAKIANLNLMFEKLLKLELDGIGIMDKELNKFSDKFVENYQENKKKLTTLEKQINNLEKVCEKNCEQIEQAEKVFLQMQESYQFQVQQIANISEQISNLSSKKPEIQQPDSSHAYKDFLPGYRSSEIAQLYRELDNMHRELQRLMSSVEYNQRYERLKNKEMEIEHLRMELERKITYNPAFVNPYQMPYGQMPYSQPPYQYMPYPQGLPPQQPYPQPPLEGLKLDEVKKEEVKAAPKEEVPTVEVKEPQEIKEFKEEIDRIKEEILQLKDQQLQNHNDSVGILKEMQNELSRSLEERDSVSTSNAKDIESYKEQLEQKEKEKSDLLIENADLLTEKEVHIKKIEYLENEINNRENTLTEMQERLDKLTEDDIIDPEFKRRIRVVREMEKDVLSRLEKEEQYHIENQEEIFKKVETKKKAVDDLLRKIESLDQNYKENPDKSAVQRDVYERSKGKHLIELQLQRESLSDLEEEQEKIELKYQQFERTKKSELSTIKAKEAEILEYFLNRLRKEIQEGEGFQEFRNVQLERDELSQQLAELRAKPVAEEVPTQLIKLDEEEIKEELSIERKDQIELTIEKLESEIEEHTESYRQLYQKMNELKSELDKRIEYEKELRSKEEEVSTFYSHKLSLNDCIKQAEEIHEKAKGKHERLIQINEDPMQKTEYLRLKAEINDLEVHKKDIDVKVDYYKKGIRDLEGRSIIGTYMTLINQINKIRDAQKDIREKAESIKQSSTEKTRLIEQLKERLVVL